MRVLHPFPILPTIVQRKYSRQAFDALRAAGHSPLFARIYAARGIARPQQLDHAIAGLLSLSSLKNAKEMARHLADAIAARKKILIIADYDADGATACAVGVRALREFGACVDYLAPNRFEYGYGLTPEIVALAATRNPDVLLTVDNGIASVEGVAAANARGIDVLVTDHHLPGAALPDALCIVNPNQPGCEFPSKNLAGVGVIFYVLVALRTELRERGALTAGEPKLSKLLDLVALGTVADVVKLDDNNRILVRQGLKRICAGRAHAGVAALLQVARRDAQKASCYELGFMLGPRLNAAGRLADMALGIECLLSDDSERALAIAVQLDALNRERRDIETGMQETALAALDNFAPADTYSIVLYDRTWHQGVIGIVASRIKDKFHRPTIVFARGNGDEIKGSGRSIAALHLRDALDLVAKRHPGLLVKFGGHAAAAGLTLREADFGRFRDAFEKIASDLVTAADLARVIETDGSLSDDEISIENARTLNAQIWGQGFAQPAFHDRFTVDDQRMVGDKHLKLKLRKAGRAYEAMLFFATDPLPETIETSYRLDVNDFDGAGLQLTIGHWQQVCVAESAAVL